MKLDEINKILDRINRLIDQINNKETLPFEWSYTFPDGQECTYYFKNIKNPDEIEDNLTSAFVWLWSLKDYYKSLAKSKGVKPSIVEEMINQDDYLPLCGDIANKLKHSSLRNFRSKHKPSLGSVTISGSSEKNPFRRISYHTDRVEFEMGDSSSVEYTLPIIDEATDENIDDAFNLLANGIKSMDIIHNKINNLAQQFNKHGPANSARAGYHNVND